MTVLKSGATGPSCTERDPQSLATAWSAMAAARRRPSIFLTPEWLAVARAHDPHKPRTLATGPEPLGIVATSQAPDGTISFGGGDLSDEQDVVAPAGSEADVARSFADWIIANTDRVDLQCVPPDAPTLDILAELLGAAGYRIDRVKQVTSPRIALPGDFEEHVQSLGKKERHELRRKMRRLETAGAAQFRFASDAERPAVLDRFIELHRTSRGEKAEFMSEANERFFRDIADALAPLGRLRLGVMRVGDNDAAVLVAFAYGDTLALYNAAYDQSLASLSIGIASHAEAIRASIAEGFKVYDLLRGDEPYKYDLGAVDVWLERFTAVRP